MRIELRFDENISQDPGFEQSYFDVLWGHLKGVCSDRHRMAEPARDDRLWRLADRCGKGGSAQQGTGNTCLRISLRDSPSVSASYVQSRRLISRIEASVRMIRLRIGSSGSASYREQPNGRTRRNEDMRFMLIIKATGDSEAGKAPSREVVDDSRTRRQTAKKKRRHGRCLEVGGIEDMAAVLKLTGIEDMATVLMLAADGRHETARLSDAPPL